MANREANYISPSGEGVLYRICRHAPAFPDARKPPGRPGRPGERRNGAPLISTSRDFPSKGLRLQRLNGLVSDLEVPKR